MECLKKGDWAWIGLAGTGMKGPKVRLGDPNRPARLPNLLGTILLGQV